MNRDFSQALHAAAGWLHKKAYQPPVYLEEDELWHLEKLLRRAASNIERVEDLRIQIAAMKERERE